MSAAVDIYDVIATRYRELFPLDHERVAFIRSFYTSTSPRILDVGCATTDSPGEGQLALPLHGKKQTVFSKKAGFYAGITGS